MASQRVVVAAIIGDAIADEEIRRVDVPSRVNFWASCVTKGDQLAVLLNRTEILPAGNLNIEVSADVIDTSRDQLLFGTVVGRGQLRVPVPAVTTELQFLLSVEPLALS
jgi:hypothetical protein